MPGIAQVWLTEDELDVLVRAVVRYVPSFSETDMATRTALLDKLRPLAYGTSCEVSEQGGAQLGRDEVGGTFDGEAPEPKVGERWCPGDYFTELK